MVLLRIVTAVELVLVGGQSSEPFLGPLTGRPEMVFLALNPGRAFPFQRRDGAFPHRVRELGFRDLGGLAFDLHRFRRRNDELVLGKLAALDAVDRELRAIERVLDERRDIIELREPGVAACPRCGALHGSDFEVVDTSKLRP